MTDGVTMHLRHTVVPFMPSAALTNHAFCLPNSVPGTRVHRIWASRRRDAERRRSHCLQQAR